MTRETLETKLMDGSMINERLNRIETSIDRMANAMERMVAIEVQHAETRESLRRAFTVIEQSDERLGEIEKNVATWNIAAYGIGVAYLATTAAAVALVWAKATGG